MPAESWRRESERWLGTPYRTGGADRRGMDCSGFTLAVCKAVAGMNLPHNAAQQFGCGVSVPLNALRPGDLVFFSEPAKGVFHVGLSLGGDRFIHASTTRGVIVCSLREPYYHRRYCGARRLVAQ